MLAPFLSGAVSGQRDQQRKQHEANSLLEPTAPSGLSYQAGIGLAYDMHLPLRSALVHPDFPFNLPGRFHL